jgi:hypothetical protein
MLKQAGVKDEFGVSTSLEAKGFFARVGRAFARISLQKELSLLSNIGTPWAVKSFPILFYYLKSYVPKSTKIIAIYRHPLAVAESFMKAWEGGRYSFDQVIELWSRANKDMLYHLSGRESVLVCYEDLFIPEKNEKMLQTLKDFVGSNASLDELKKVLDPALNRSSKKADELAKNYVLSGEAQETYRILNKLKI